MKLLIIKNAHYGRRVEIKAELRRRGLHGKTYPKNLDEVPADMRALFEIVQPDAYAPL